MIAPRHASNKWVICITTIIVIIMLVFRSYFVSVSMKRLAEGPAEGDTVIKRPPGCHASHGADASTGATNAGASTGTDASAGARTNAGANTCATGQQRRHRPPPVWRCFTDEHGDCVHRIVVDATEAATVPPRTEAATVQDHHAPTPTPVQDHHAPMSGGRFGHNECMTQ